MTTRLACIHVLLVALLFATRCAAWLHRSTPSTTRTLGKQVSSSSQLHVLYDPRQTEDEFVDFPTPSQRTTLRKEASKRQARKELTTLSISPEETLGPFSRTTLDEVWATLQGDELVQIRGISKDERKWVFGTAERLCAELEMIQSDLPVSLLSTKGHTAIFFSPTLPKDHPLHITLRTSVGQKNTWRASPKAPRDNRGQIIKPHDVE